MGFDIQFRGYAGRLSEFIRLAARNAQDQADTAITASFAKLALELFALQFEHNLPYRRFCEARGVTPQDISRWNQVPAMPAAGFKELELSCLPPKERSRVFHSSGTTERNPSRHFHNSRSLAIYEQSIWPWFARHLYSERLTPAPSLFLLTPPPEAAPHSSLAHMFERIHRQGIWGESDFLGGVNQRAEWVLDLAAIADRLRRAAATGRPVMLLGTAFSFVHLVDYLAEQETRFELPAGSRAMETGGYKGRSRSLPRANLHALITTRLGIPPSHIVCEYGMSELSSQAYDRVAGAHATEHSRQFHFPPWARVQLISPETGEEVSEGEIGLVRVFDLANAFSVMAVQTEDLGVRGEAGFELAGRAPQAEIRGCSLMAR